MLHKIDQLGTGLKSLLLSESLTWLGLLMGHIAVTWWVAQGGGASDMVIYGSSVAIISLVATPLLAPLGDKYSKRTLRIISVGLFSFQSFLLFFVSLSNQYNLLILIALEGIALCTNVVFASVSSAQLTEIFSVKNLSEIFQLQKAFQSTGRLLGPAIAGVALASSGTALCFAIQTCVFAIATWLCGNVPKSLIPINSRKSSWSHEIRHGLKSVWQVSIERGWIICTFFSYLFLFPILNMLVPLKIQSIHLSSFWFGLCEVSLSTGMLFSALIGCKLMVRKIGRRWTRAVASVLLAFVLCIIGATDNPYVLVTSFAFVGLSNTMILLVGITHRTLARPAILRARMTATASMIQDMACIFSPALAGLALSLLPVGSVYVLFGIAGALLSLALIWLPGIRNFFALSHIEVEEWYGKTNPEIYPK